MALIDYAVQCDIAIIDLRVYIQLEDRAIPVWIVFSPVADQTCFDWDGAKSNANKAKHGISFDEAVLVFGASHVAIGSQRGEEERILAVGQLDGREIAVVFCIRAGVIRLISARRARDYERRAYRAHHPGAGEES